MADDYPIRKVARKADDDNGRIRVERNGRGDLHLLVWEKQTDTYASIVFCQYNYIDEDRSPNTRRALFELLKAIEQDNAADPTAAIAQ